MGFAETLLEGQREVLREAAARRELALERILPDARLWMAVAPGWTASLAEKAGFPAGSEGVRRTLDDMAAQGLCTAKPVLGTALRDPASGRLRPSPSERYYVMDAETRRRIAGEARQDPGRGSHAVKHAIAAAGRAVLKARCDGGTVPDSTHTWAMLASQVEQPSELRRRLDYSVNEALDTSRFADAVMWVEAALPIEQLLADEIGEAVRLASLRVQLRQRRADNESYLVRFLERPEQIAAFDELLGGPDTEWALHYVGVGGVGKTMLLRHLLARVAPGRRASTARIDFDYLNPHYPSTRPALLLLQLAEELRLHADTTEAGDYFESFSRKAVTFHEGLTATDRPDRSALELIRDPAFQGLLDTFGSAAKALPQPVILVLDTCEELSKMLPDGSTPGAVAATFEILEGLHGRLPTLRVIFGGRRPLASSGAGGWHTRESHGPRREPRPYMRLHEIRGFGRKDAKSYLAEKAECPKHLIPAILKHCAERGYVSQFTWTSARKAPTAEPRYSPFELALYGIWAREDPLLTADKIASTDVDQYIKVRIVGRIHNATVTKLLPAIAWLGRFDAAAVAALSGFGADPTRARELFDEIASQEWIDRQHDLFLEIERELRPRLLAYFRASDAAATETARQACAAYLERLTLHRPLAELGVSIFEAMLRVLMADPEHAARWWEAVEERVRLDNAYAWILAVTTRLLAEENWPETVLKGPHIRAAILATHAAALIHERCLPPEEPGPEHRRRRDLDELEEIWAAAEKDAERYPMQAGARRLRLRASGGRGVIPDFSPGDMDEQMAATLIGSMERRWFFVPAEALVRLVALFREGGYAPELRAFMCILAGRALVWAGRSPEAAWLFKDALALRVVFSSTTQRWLDWLAPDDLSSRIAFEFLLWAYPAEMSPRECLWWFDDRPEPRGLNADRFAAALLLLEGAERVPAQEIDSQTIARSRTLGLSVRGNERSGAHQRLPPLYVVAAQEMALRNRIPEALELLQAQSGEAESSSVAYDEVLASDRELMRIFRRFRLMDGGYRAKDSVLGSEAPDDRLLCAALDALGPTSDIQAFHDSLPGGDFRQESAAVKHAHWRAFGIRPREISEAVAWAALALADIKPTPEAGFYDLSCVLDLVEASEVARALGLTEPSELPRDLPDVASWQQQHPTQPVEALTLWLRAAALGRTGGPRASQALLELGERVGRRRAATIALEEGELLALRLPERSLKVLDLADRLFAGCGDHLQAWMARACASLARARLGRPRGPIPRLKTATVPGGQELWAQVVDLVEEGTPIEDPWLRPWLLRVAACMAFQRDQERHAGRMARVAAAWSELAFLPTEVAGWLETAAPKTATAAPSIIGHEAAPSRRILSFRSIRPKSIFERTEIIVTLHTDDLVTEPIYLQTPPSDAPYRVIREALRFELSRWPLKIAGERSLQNLQLLVDPFSAWIPWEAVLAGSKSAYLPFTRVAARRRPDFQPSPLPEHLTAHTLTINHAGADLSGSVWNFAPWTYAHAPRDLVAHLAPGDAQILHVIADPIETSAGVRLRLSEREFTEAERTKRGLLLRSEEIGKLPAIPPSQDLCGPRGPLSHRVARIPPADYAWRNHSYVIRYPT